MWWVLFYGGNIGCYYCSIFVGWCDVGNGSIKCDYLGYVKSC